MSPLPAPPALAAARRLLTTTSIAPRVAPYVGDDRIDWDGLFAESTAMSGGERFIVDIARRLCSGEPLPTAYEVSGQLDVLNARRVADALDQLPGSAHADLPLAA